MQQLLPNQEIIPALKNTCTFFYFFELKGSSDIGAEIRQKFAKQQAKCLYWLDCKYAKNGLSTKK
ncbi:MAG: hypothetical protein AAF960_25420 [Bacteroidota bacterium]